MLVLAIAIPSLVVSACVGSAPIEGLSGPSEADLARIAAPAYPPTLVATDAAGARMAARGAATASSARFNALPGSKMVEISAIPWLRASPEGEIFLATSFPRALARGAPAASCPAAAPSAFGPEPARSRSEAAETALSACLAILERRGAPASCGCRLVAVDDALLAPQGDFSFAPAVSALLIGPEGPRRLVAESLRPLMGAELVTLRDARGEVARVALLDDQAELMLPSGARFAGRRETFGYRRGRLAERLVLTGPSGEDMTVLIGVEARDAFKG
ncbi:MAG: hypothetical protein ACK5MQ_11630 [Pikeienuella sp.]